MVCCRREMKTHFLILAIVLLAHISRAASSVGPGSLDCRVAVIDSNVSTREALSEQNYFIINGILEAGLTEEQLQDSLLQHSKWLTMEHREMLYKQHHRFTIPTCDGLFGPFIPIPLITPIIVGDVVGIGMLVGGVALMSGAAAGELSPVVTNVLFYCGFGAFIGSQIHANMVNNARIEFNKALAGVLRVPINFSYQLSPTVRSLPDGSLVPGLSFAVRF